MWPRPGACMRAQTERASGAAFQLPPPQLCGGQLALHGALDEQLAPVSAPRSHELRAHRDRAARHAVPRQAVASAQVLSSHARVARTRLLRHRMLLAASLGRESCVSERAPAALKSTVQAGTSQEARHHALHARRGLRAPLLHPAGNTCHTSPAALQWVSPAASHSCAPRMHVLDCALQSYHAGRTAVLREERHELLQVRAAHHSFWRVGLQRHVAAAHDELAGLEHRTLRSHQWYYVCKPAGHALGAKKANRLHACCAHARPAAAPQPNHHFSSLAQPPAP